MSAPHQSPPTSVSSLADQPRRAARWRGTPAPGYESTTIRLAPGEVLPVLDDEWTGALIVVVDGSIALECRGGAIHTFPAGSILWFSGLGLHAARNTATAPTTLVGTRRLADPGR